MVKVKPVQLGKTERMSFSRIDEVIDMPNLIEVQKNSYNWFLKEGLKEVFRDISTIEDYSGNLVLDFIDYRLDSQPKYTIKECKERDATYAAPLRVTARLLNKETGEVKEQEIFMGDFPLMTDSGTFLYNGAERVIVSQLVRSPGVYFGKSYDKTGKELFTATMNPNRGAWLEFETDSNDVFYVRIDKNRKIPVTVFLRALGLGDDARIRDFFGDDERIEATLAKDPTTSEEEGLLDMARSYYGPNVERVFLMDGDAIVMRTEQLLQILEKLYAAFPKLQKVTTYAGPRSTLSKTPEELRALREAGLTRAYLGVESGSDAVLQAIQKGCTAAEMLQAGQNLVAAGIDLWAIVILLPRGSPPWIIKPSMIL